MVGEPVAGSGERLPIGCYESVSVIFGMRQEQRFTSRLIWVVRYDILIQYVVDSYWVSPGRVLAIIVDIITKMHSIGVVNLHIGIMVSRV
jgi:hypothetical protein